MRFVCLTGEEESKCCLRVQGEARDLPPNSRCALKPFGSKPHILYWVDYNRSKVPAV